MRLSSPIVLAVALWAATVANARFNPCHDIKLGEYQLTHDAPECSEIIIPSHLCSKCHVKKFNDSFFLEEEKWESEDPTKYQLCSSTMDLTSDSCRSALAQYRDHNPCDTVRGPQITAFLNGSEPNYAQEVDYLVYSLCENCCDCIQAGSLKGNKTMDLSRGNCPSHAAWDICLLFSNISGFRQINSKSGNITERLTGITEQMCDWDKLGQTRPLTEQSQVELSDMVLEFLEEYVQAAGCRKKKVWNRCWKQESNQGRV